MPKELEEAPDCPAGFEYLWDWFMRLNKTRPPAMEGTTGIPETEIRAYFENRQDWPELWELKILERLDAVAIEVGNKSHEREEQEED